MNNSVRMKQSVNEEIRAPKVVLIDENGNNRGEIPTPQALYRAKQNGLDLVEVQKGDKAKGTWPICKILDYGKMKYEQSKKKSQKKSPSLKEMSFQLRTDPHDLEIKIGKIKNFLSKGHQVRLSISLKGRERSFKDDARQKLQDQIDALKQVAKADRIMESDKTFQVMLSPI